MQNKQLPILVPVPVTDKRLPLDGHTYMVNMMEGIHPRTLPATYTRKHWRALPLGGNITDLVTHWYEPAHDPRPGTIRLVEEAKKLVGMEAFIDNTEMRVLFYETMRKILE